LEEEMSFTRRIALRAALLITLFAVSLASAPLSDFGTTIIVEPPNPTEYDVVVIEVSGWFMNSCGRWIVEPSLQQVGENIVISGVPAYVGSICLQVLVPWSFAFELGYLPAGTYTVTMVENWSYGPELTTETFTVGPAGTCCVGTTGNIDGSVDDMLDVSDVAFLVDYMFGNGPAPECPEEAELVPDGSSDISDLVYLINYLFRDGPPPPACP
jgi:hypothetical protein